MRLCRERIPTVMHEEPNLFVVAVSYVFYGWWDWRFLILIAFTSLWSFVFGLLELNGKPRSRTSKLRLVLSCVINLGILGYFKYCDFFVAQAVVILRQIGFDPHVGSLNIILPVGISFYTFQALSYTIDVYRRQIVPTKDPIAFFAFISFFPQLVAGPIERATNLLPQFLRPRQFDYPLAVEGCRQMLWGFFKKVLVADSCAYAANTILGHPHASSVSFWVGMTCFTFQIYGDFSGYSDIAIGCSKLFGVRLMRNFSMPYFSRDIAEFWRRWHISLTTWFRDYLYIPLGGSRCGRWKKVRNTFAIFLTSGFWHGASWNFLAWGAFHAVCFLPLLLRNKNRKYAMDFVAQGHLLASCRELASMILTFGTIVVGWTLFRAQDISTAGTWLWKMLTFSDLSLKHCDIGAAKMAVLPVIALLVIEWMNRGLDIPRLPQKKWIRWGVYVAVCVAIAAFSPMPQTFIYFQF